jgi:hypothetical protein
MKSEAVHLPFPRSGQMPFQKMLKPSISGSNFSMFLAFLLDVLAVLSRESKSLMAKMATLIGYGKEIC